MLRLGLISALTLVVFACDQEHKHDHSIRSYAPPWVTPPPNDLVWGDINIIHTTDSHGWLQGHQKSTFPEPNYSGDFGDFAQFVTRMKQIAANKQVDLLLVDSGDLHDGSGLTDAYPPDSVDGRDANEIFALLPYDLLTIGNHELYNYSVALDVHQNFVPKWNGSYLTSNAYITLPGANSDIPIGAQFKKFTTAHNRTILSFGVLFDFRGAKGTTTQTVEAMVNETWFNTALDDQDIDLFVIPGHMPVTPGDEFNKWQYVHTAIRKQHPDTPIIYLGGHSHIRDCAVFNNADNTPDGRSLALESGRYMETVGWLSANLTAAPQNVEFSRRYLDTNTATYEYHTSSITNYSIGSVDRDHVSGRLDALADNYNLSYVYGWPTQNYTLNQSPYESADYSNLLQFWVKKALPFALSRNTERKDPFQIVTNNSSQRFDIYSGSFTRNDALSASFYTDVFLYISLPYSMAQAVIAEIAKHNVNENSPFGSPGSFVEERGFSYADMRYRGWVQEMSQVTKNDAEKTLGYVTVDHCLGKTDGDDTPHTPLPFYPVPTYIWSSAPSVASNSTNIDLVILDYIWNTSHSISVQNITKDITGKSYVAQLYSPLPSYEATALYAEACWKLDGSKEVGC